MGQAHPALVAASGVPHTRARGFPPVSGERFALQEKLQRHCERRYERDNANDEEAEPDLVHSRQ